VIPTPPKRRVLNEADDGAEMHASILRSHPHVWLDVCREGATVAGVAEGATARMAVHGGWIYRQRWRTTGECSLVFVPVAPEVVGEGAASILRGMRGALAHLQGEETAVRVSVVEGKRKKSKGKKRR